ncbi:MAG: phage portal protein, partial [Clostridia bacterium]|nr:phage portal protein [Clostridia bacterium]
SKCEFRTFQNFQEVFGDEYYLWNVEPNRNQNSSQFLQEMIHKLLYENECLILDVGGKLIVADGFYQEEYAVNANRFSRVHKNNFTFSKTFSMDEVMYLKLNNDSIKDLFSELCRGYEKLSGEAIEKYIKSGGNKGILKISSIAKGKPDFEENYKKLMNDYFSTYFNGKNAVLPLFEGYDFTQPAGDGTKKSTSEIDDIRKITDAAFEKVGQAFKIPPALMRGDIADVENATDNMLTFAIDPLCDMIQEEANRKRYGKDVLKGDYLMIDTNCIKHIDIFQKAEQVDKLISSSMYCVDELRRKARDAELRTGFAKKYFITKNYEENKENGGGEGEA